MVRASITAALLLLLAGCNYNGSPHVPFTYDNTMTQQDKANEAARLAVCDDMQGARPDQVAFCRQELGGPGNSSGGSTYTICSAGCMDEDTVTVYGPN